ncbi:MAG: hypothetical protein FWG77_07965 [Treponema sp.]|nr:hypothetical protein [Treponema sp.]
MREFWQYENCVTILSGEIELLKEISTIHEKVRQAVMDKEWSDFEERTNEINKLGDEFVRLENERLMLFSGEDEEKSFYASIMDLPADQRQELSALYRELKMETLKMRALNENFLDYISEAKTLAASYLEAIYPARGGKLYTRKGDKVSQDLRSMVINNRF